ncbi:alpha/beta fold hydrolase [Glaciecola sp. XM2]|uniref:alpha/beta hydrolase n=1 Tax=Glaciecola sp. XM2 TaxID=1914931 RepID=UPI001BDF2A08|nr:alpha/beta fold hydrolase [Glaciecola sp. XM2]MBT1450500.1 alpha/beta fold hydrolase [Glaciecola sp. XM2]
MNKSMRLKLHHINRWIGAFGVGLALCITSVVHAQSMSATDLRAPFANIYQNELGSVVPCQTQLEHEVKVCSQTLRNEGNAPYIYVPQSPKATVVLFHGLSDSPFYLRSIADELYRQGYIVIVPLTPGHGKREADADMQDPTLQARWYQHVESVMALAHQSHEQVFVGGFSTGGTFATRYMLLNPEKVQGLLLFSGAFQLSSTAESMANIWGIETVAAWLDGEYETDGPNPYKYPSVASYSALQLIKVIEDVRERLVDNEVSKPIFAAHSMSDKTTLYEGVADLLSKVPGDHTEFKIDESFEVCHGDITLSAAQLISMEFDKSRVNPKEKCKTPEPNPLHRSMMQVLVHFINEHTKVSDSPKQLTGASSLN